MNDVTKDLLEALKGLLVRAADDEEYGPNHAVTVARVAIARAEAALAEPQPDADGWIPWAATATSQCPVGQDTWVAVRLANGPESKEGKPHQAGQFFWGVLPAGSIIAYRIVRK